MSSERLDKLATIILKRIKLTAAKRFGALLVNDLRFRIEADRDTDSEADWLAGEFVAKLWTFVLAERVQETTAYAYFERPASWWQHFKQDVFPEWLLRRFPVRLETQSKAVTIEVFEAFPQFSRVYPDEAINSFQIIEQKKEGE